MKVLSIVIFSPQYLIYLNIWHSQTLCTGRCEWDFNILLDVGVMIRSKLKKKKKNNYLLYNLIKGVMKLQIMNKK